MRPAGDAAGTPLFVWSTSDRKRRIGELDRVQSHFVIPWILRVVEENVLAAAFVTDVLARWSVYAGLLNRGSDRLPSSADPCPVSCPDQRPSDGDRRREETAGSHASTTT